MGGSRGRAKGEHRVRLESVGKAGLCEGRIMSGVRDGVTLGSVSESVGWRSETEDGFLQGVRERPTV